MEWFATDSATASLAFRIFHAKKPEIEALYPQLLICVGYVLEQSTKAIERVAQRMSEVRNVLRIM